MQLLYNISYLLQALGFIFIVLAWIRALRELRHGTRFYNTRLLMFIITSVTLFASAFPAFIAYCYFREGCEITKYRDIIRFSNASILFLYGLFKFLLYYTKDGDGQAR